MSTLLGRGLPAQASRRFQVLCLSGGGMRGLYTASVLEALEVMAGRPLGQCFDLIAGTSVGGIIALGLGLGQRASFIRQCIEEAGPRLFPPHERVWRRIRGLFRARYDEHALATLVRNVLASDARLCDLERPVLVPALALTRGGMQMFRTPHHPAHHHQGGTGVVDVALSTAAAPGLFPMARIADARYLDGGLIANAPDALALNEATVFFAKSVVDVFMLSVGTTTDLSALAAGARRSRGLIYWLRRGRLVELAMSAQQQLSVQLAREALGVRYIAINTPRSRSQAAAISLDRADTQAIATLRAMASHSVEELARDAALNQLLSHYAQRRAGVWPDKG